MLFRISEGWPRVWRVWLVWISAPRTKNTNGGSISILIRSPPGPASGNTLPRLWVVTLLGGWIRDEEVEQMEE